MIGMEMTMVNGGAMVGTMETYSGLEVGMIGEDHGSGETTFQGTTSGGEDITSEKNSDMTDSEEPSQLQQALRVYSHYKLTH